MINLINMILVAPTPYEEAPELLIFGAILGIFLMIWARKTNGQLYSILSAGVWIFLGYELRNEIAIVLVMIGLVFCNMYIAFFSRCD